jgi:hypothetical protein
MSNDYNDYSDTDVQRALQWLERFFSLDELQAASVHCTPSGLFIATADRIVSHLDRIAQSEQALRNITQEIREMVELGLKAKKRKVE